MRWYILRSLIHKEVLRHLSNRGGIALAILLIGMALLLAVFGRSSVMQTLAGGMRGASRCYIDYWDDSPWVDYLKANVPESLHASVHFRDIRREYAGREGELISYPAGAAAIQMRPAERPNGPLVLMCWHPGPDRTAMAPFEIWFWRTSRAYFRQDVHRTLASLGPAEAHHLGLPALPRDDSWMWLESHALFRQQVDMIKSRLSPEIAERIHVPDLEVDYRTLGGQPVGTQYALSVALVLFALFFVCVYLLPSLACEERESGVLLAQALSPASPVEILTAKLLFYPTIAILFAALLAGLAKPAVLQQPFLWLTLIVLGFGSMGIGVTISCLARTQRAASMTALCYILVISLCILICQQNGVSFLPQLLLEYHGPRMLNAAISEQVTQRDYISLALSGGLALGWNVAATYCFRRFGWQ